ncbi:hypothetical protein [Rubritalea sp.]|uniref:hypothetical protein n=1 Tax=Rubritalea sp. TaxID=2109375 RepID=UPI003EF1851D
MSEYTIEEFKQEAHSYLQAYLGKLPSIQSVPEHQWAGQEVGHPSELRYTLKQIVHVGDSTWTLHAVLLANAQPRYLRNAIYAAKAQWKLQPDTGTYLLIVSPYISEQAAALCREESVGFIDLSGNAYLSFGSVYVEIAGKPNKYKESRPLKSLFSEKSCRVLRVLLQGPLKAHKVQKVAEAADVSLGLVSKVRKLLIDHEHALDTGDGILITQPDKLLNAWIAADRFSERTEIREYSLLECDIEHLSNSIEATLASELNIDLAYTQWYAGYLRKPYTVPPVVSLYVSDFIDEELLKTVLQARRVTSGGRLRLIRSKDHKGVTLGKQQVNGHTLVSDLQILLDLQGAGLRADEQAAELRADETFNGGWKT